MAQKYLISITASLLLAAAFVVFRIFVRHAYLREGRLTPFSSFLQLIIFFLHGMSSYVYLDSNFNHINRKNPLFFLAVLCMVAGVVLLSFAMSSLGMGVSLGVRVTGLKQSDFYRYTRNPQIVTVSLIYIGYALLWPSWTGMVWLGILGAMLHMMVLTEEEHLRNIFGGEYERYCARTPRYVRFKKK